MKRNTLIKLLLTIFFSSSLISVNIFYSAANKIESVSAFTTTNRWVLVKAPSNWPSVWCRTQNGTETDDFQFSSYINGYYYGNIKNNTSLIFYQGGKGTLYDKTDNISVEDVENPVISISSDNGWTPKTITQSTYAAYLGSNGGGWNPMTEIPATDTSSGLMFTTNHTFNYVDSTNPDQFKLAFKIASDDTDYWGFNTLKYGNGTARNAAQIQSAGGDGSSTDTSNLRANTPGTYSITFYPNGGSAGDGSGSIHIDAISTKTISISADSGGTVSKSPNISTFGYGATLSVSATPDSSHDFEKWSDGNTNDERDIIVSSTTPTSFTASFIPKASSTTISFDDNGGQGGQSESVVATNGQNMPTITATPTKTNNQFLGYYDSKSGGTKYYNADKSSAKTWDKVDLTYTLYAHWSLNNGTYLGLKSENWAQDGQHLMKLNGTTGTQYVVKGLTLSANEEIRAYYESLNYGDINSITWSHPSYKGEKSGNNCKVLEAGTYDVYYDTTSGEMHLAVPSMPSNGRYFVLDSDLSKSNLIKTEEWSGSSSYTEYKAMSISITKNQYLSAYFQNSSQATEYFPLIRKGSLKEWIWTSGEGLKCPETGVYDLYLISSDGTNWNEIAIYKQGETDATSYATTFNTNIGAQCTISAQQGYNKGLQDAWDLMATSWTSLSELAKGCFTTDVNPESVIGQCITKYTECLRKYGNHLSDFMGLYTDPNTGKLILPMSHHQSNVSITDDSVISVVILSSLTLITIGGFTFYFLYKKRRNR